MCDIKGMYGNLDKLIGVRAEVNSVKGIILGYTFPHLDIIRLILANTTGEIFYVDVADLKANVRIILDDLKVSTNIVLEEFKNQ